MYVNTLGVCCRSGQKPFLSGEQVHQFIKRQDSISKVGNKNKSIDLGFEGMLDGSLDNLLVQTSVLLPTQFVIVSLTLGVTLNLPISNDSLLISHQPRRNEPQRNMGSLQFRLVAENAISWYSKLCHTISTSAPGCCSPFKTHKLTKGSCQLFFCCIRLCRVLLWSSLHNKCIPLDVRHC